jgi:hypothetical protein
MAGPYGNSYLMFNQDWKDPNDKNYLPCLPNLTNDETDHLFS